MKFNINFLYHNFFNHFHQKIVFSNGYTFAKPVNFSVTPTIRCNCKCIMCDIYKKKTEEDLNYQQIENALGDIRQWLGYPYFINISGGEPLLYKDIYRLIAFCSKNSIYPKITTNGFLLNERNCDKLIEAGLEYLSISIDSLKPEIHDEMRGVSGVLEKALAGVKYLQKNGMKVGVNTVISNKNVEEVVPLTKNVFEDYKIARLSFQPIRPTFASKIGFKEFCDSDLWIKDLQKAETSINSLIGLKKHYNILNSEEDLQSYCYYFKEPGKKLEVKGKSTCMVGTTNFFIDSTGDTRFCWFLKPFGTINNEGDFCASETWNSEQAKKIRLQTIRCQKPCTSRCHRSISLVQKIRYFLFLRRR